MRWIPAALLLPLFSALLANASPVGDHHHHRSYVEGRNDTGRLFPRVRTGPNSGRFDPKKAADLFLFDDAPGGCSSRESTLDKWVEEAMLLHTAIERLYANVKGDLVKGLLWYVWFGVQVDMETRDIDFKDKANKELWQAIGDHIARVGQFLSGGGLRNPQVPGQNPRLFCGAEAGTLQSWANSVVRDKNGEDVVVYEDPQTGKKEYLNLGMAFMNKANDPMARPFWIDAFNGYDIHFNGQDSLCPTKPTDDKGLRYAKTGRTIASWGTILSDAVFEFGKANGHILFCPPSFSPEKGSHSYASLAKAVDEDNYPTAGLEDDSEALDQMLTVSATMYHELYHLTDPDNTPDQSRNMGKILWNAKNPKTRVANSHNPETYAYVAMAAYLVFNAPPDEEPCLYMGPYPKRASNPFDR